MRKTSTALLAAAALTVGTTLAAAPAGALDFGSVTGALGRLCDLRPGSPGAPGPTDPGEPGEPGEPGTEDPAPEAPGEDGPRVSFDADGPYASGQTVTVSGEGFSGEGAGIYVGLVQDDQFSPTDASTWMKSKWVTAADIVDGSWSQELELVAVNEKGDCFANACSIYTVSAHGSPDRSQDTQTPVAFD